MNEDNAIEASSPLFIAYVYPGWHASSYRPGVNEWDLLDRFKPYFEAHQPPPHPLHGQYDDSEPETALRQMEMASAFGVKAFTYFLYYRPDQFIMSEPILAALRMAPLVPGFRLSQTWCIRLPHDHFPIELREKYIGVSMDVGEASTFEREETDVHPEDKPIEELSLTDLEYLLGPQAFDDIFLVQSGGY